MPLWNSPYLGNFMECQLRLAEEVRSRFGYGTHFVLGDGAQGQAWRADVERAGASASVATTPGSALRQHIIEVAEAHSGALIHTHFSAPDLAGASAAHELGIPCIWQAHTGFDVYRLPQRAKDVVKMRIIARRRVDRLLVVSPWLADLTRRRGAPGDRIHVIPNPIATERFSEAPDRAAARTRLGLSPDALVVLALGWWPTVKGVDVFVDALDGIAARRGDVEGLLVGEEDMRAFLDERLPRPPPWLRVTGFVEDAAWLFAAADVFVSASRHEGQSGAIGEALACGLPVVMSDIPGSAEWAAAPHMSVFPSEDSAALAARLEPILAASPDQRRARGAEAALWVTATHGIDAWCERMSAIYAELLPVATARSEPSRAPAA
ncbi:MAG TPA: glycosyltransferase family 4 protein [Solirubrobacteraceae bacterium]|nr:glycosyltransferase family 4 protein [Solirubrobacteraceae bacterium]